MLSFKSLLMTIECKMLYVRLMRKKQINLVKLDIIMSSRALASQRNKRSTGSYNQQPAIYLCKQEDLQDFDSR